MFFFPPRNTAKWMAGLVATAAGACCSLTAEIPDTLRQSLFAPKTEPQRTEQQGSSVATGGGLVAAGSPLYDLNEDDLLDVGVVKLYDAVSGDLVRLLHNPSPIPFDYFGGVLAMSGTRLAVAAGSDGSGNPYSGRVCIYDLASATPEVPVATLNNPSPGNYDQFGHAVAIDGDRVAVGAWLDDTDAVNSGRVYIYDLSGTNSETPVLVLANPSPEVDDCFGNAVALSGDKLVVGSYQDDTGSPNSGTAYVYDLGSATANLPLATLANPDPGPNDGFGTSVAASGTMVVIGAEGDDTGAGNAGSVYVYHSPSGTPPEASFSIPNPGPEINDCFGTAVAASATAIVVGAYQDNQDAPDAGIAYVYDPAGALITTLHEPTPEEAELFGVSVAVSGSVVAVGAMLDDSEAEDGGSTYVFDVSTATPGTALAMLGSPSAASPDRFGNAVAISGDWLAVGAALADVTAKDAGRVSVYNMSAPKPSTPVVTIENPSPAAGDGFGISLGLSGRWLLVGAAGDAAGSGSAYLYDLLSASPSVPVRTFPNPTPAAGDGFGGAVAISGNYAVIGAAGDDTGSPDSGRAYLFKIDSAMPANPVATLAKSSPVAQDAFGSSVAISGNRVIAGVPGDDTGAVNAGAARVFDLAGAAVATLPNPGAATDDRFGSALGISGTRVVIGCGGDDTGATNAGSAYVFDLGSGNPTQPTATLANPTPIAEDQFGHAVAISSGLVMIGAPLDDTGGTNAGRAYLFDVSGTPPTAPLTSQGKSSPFTEDRFGSSVAIGGVIAVIGVPLDNRTAADKGAAYVYGPSAPEIAVESPSEVHLGDGVSIHDFGAQEVGKAGAPGSFVISNTGITGLNVSNVTVSGGNAADFTVSTAGLAGSIGAGNDDSFTVTFGPPVAGVRTTTLLITSNDADESPFEIQLRGDSLSAANDTDGDGVNDVSELRMAALGFDWQVAQGTLAQSFLTTAGIAGFYPKEQVRALMVPAPLLSKNPSSGLFKLTIGLESSANLTNYQPFPMTSGQTEINPEGEIEFRFHDSAAALFRLETK